MEHEKLKILKEILRFSHKNGSEFLFWCKLCPTMHHKPKLSINIKKNVYKCWICGKGGKRIYDIIRKFGNKQQKERWQKIDSTIDVSQYDNLFIQQQPKHSPLTLPSEFESLSRHFYDKKYERPLEYLMNERKLTEYEIIRWRIGCCLAGEYKGRIVIPSFDIDGNLNHFIARAYDEKLYNPYKEPKSDKSGFVFNEIEINWNKPIVLVEGFFDSLKEENMIPLLGSSLSKNSKLFYKIVKNSIKTYLALDHDADKKAKKIALLLLNYDQEVCFINTEGYKDVDKMPYNVYKERKENAFCINHSNFYCL